MCLLHAAGSAAACIGLYALPAGDVVAAGSRSRRPVPLNKLTFSVKVVLCCKYC